MYGMDVGHFVLYQMLFAEIYFNNQAIFLSNLNNAYAWVVDPGRFLKFV